MPIDIRFNNVPCLNDIERSVVKETGMLPFPDHEKPYARE
jgi:hypothetical protein